MTIKSTDKDGLNEAFAIHVAGWTRPRTTGAKMMLWPPGKPKWPTEYPEPCPHFTDSADAVLPWLDKMVCWQAGKYAGGAGHWVNLGDGDSAASTLPLAVVIALLRANGVTVED